MSKSATSQLLLLAVVVISGLVNYSIRNGNEHQQSSDNIRRTSIRPTEWLQLYSCNETDSSPINWPFPGKCRRDPAAWRYKYVEEQDTSDLLVKENSIDERLANTIYVATTTNWADGDHCKFNSGDEEQDKANMASVAGPKVDDSKCKLHLHQMINLMDDLEAQVELKRQSMDFNMNLNESHLQLARILDSFGRLESGQLSSGKIKSAGSYEACLKGKLMLKSTGDGHEDVRTRFCWARLKTDGHLDESLASRDKSNYDIRSNSILTAVCLPETCHSITFANNRHLLQRIVDSQFKLPKSIYINETLELESIFCVPDREAEFSMPLQGKMLLIALIVWVALAVFATTRRFMSHEEPAEDQVWMAPMDLVDSWREFIEIDASSSTLKQKDQQVQLDTLNVVKVLSCVFIVVIHAFIVSLMYSQDTLRMNNIMDSSDLLAGATVLATCLVDTSFVLTGLILSYGLFKRLARQREALLERAHCMDKARYFLHFCGSFTLNRYLRLVPMFVMFHWFKKYVLIYLGSGPFWDYGFNKDTPNGMCRQEESWLVPFTFWSAFLPLNKQCLIQSWSISNDLFFSLFLAPLVIFMFLGKPNSAPWTALGICFISLLAFNWQLALKMSPHLYYEVQDLGHLFDLRTMTIASNLYTSPIYRLSGFSMGALGGYYLFKLTITEGNNSTTQELFTGPLVPLCYLVSALTLCVKIFLPFLRPLIMPYHSLPMLLWPLFRLNWNFGNMMLFVRLVSKWRNSPFVRLMSGKGWRIMSKLNFVILLAHYDLLMICSYFLATKTTDHSALKVLATGGSVYLLTLPLSVLLHVVFEVPINKLIRHYRS